LPLVSGGEIASTFDNLGNVKFGYFGLIEEIQINGCYHLLGLKLIDRLLGGDAHVCYVEVY
jgi:hypothetical protein